MLHACVVCHAITACSERVGIFLTRLGVNMAPELKLSRLIYSNRFIINFKSLHNFLRFQFGKCTSTTENRPCGLL